MHFYAKQKKGETIINKVETWEFFLQKIKEMQEIGCVKKIVKINKRKSDVQNHLLVTLLKDIIVKNCIILLEGNFIKVDVLHVFDTSHFSYCLFQKRIPKSADLSLRFLRDRSTDFGILFYKRQ